MQRGDLLLVDQPYQPGWITMIARCSHDQTRAGHQRPEKLPHRHVKAERRFLQHAVVWLEPICLLHPAQAVGQRYMAVASALGLTGGAGGVDHIGKVFAVHWDIRVVAAEGFQPGIAMFQHQGLHTGRNRQLRQ